MSIFKHLGEAPASHDPLDPAIEQAIDNDLMTSWNRVPQAWKQTITQEQAAEFLEGVAARTVMHYPEVPHQTLLLYLLGKAQSILTGGSSGGGDPGGGTTVVAVSAVAGNIIQMYGDGLYATVSRVDGGTFN